jgi:cytochrome P450
VSCSASLAGDDALNFREHLLRGTVGGTGKDPAEAARSYTEVVRMLKELITARRAHGGDDVVTGLINNDFQLADGGSRKLTDEEIFGYCRLIILAGGGTTWRQLDITLHALLTNYHSWEACRADRKLIEAAIEEGARSRPTDPTFPRLVTQDVEMESVTATRRAGRIRASMISLVPRRSTTRQTNIQQPMTGEANPCPNI